MISDLRFDKCIDGHEITLRRDDSGAIPAALGDIMIQKLPDPLPGSIEVACPQCREKIQDMLEQSNWLK